jgi:hypothetical protein
MPLVKQIEFNVLYISTICHFFSAILLQVFDSELVLLIMPCSFGCNLEAMI